MLAFIIGKPEIWLTPPWLIAAGVTLAGAVLAVVYGGVWAFSRRTAAAVVDVAREGVLLWLIWIAAALTVFTAIGLTFAPWREIAQSAAQLPFTGQADQTQRIEPGATDKPIDFPFEIARLQSLRLETDQDLSLSIRGETEADRKDYMPLAANKPVEWHKGMAMPTLFRRGVGQWLATNTGQQPATLQLTAVTGVEHPEAATVLVTALGTLAVVLLYLVPRWLTPKISVIAAAAARNDVAMAVLVSADQWRAAVVAADLSRAVADVRPVQHVRRRH